jgi:hypothetical protein
MFKFSGPDGRPSPKGEGGLPHDRIEVVLRSDIQRPAAGPPVEGAPRWENPLLVLWKGTPLAQGGREWKGWSAAPTALRPSKN